MNGNSLLGLYKHKFGKLVKDLEKETKHVKIQTIPKKIYSFIHVLFRPANFQVGRECMLFKKDTSH